MAKPSIKKNFIYNTLYEILAIISPLITAPYVSRIFGADGVGVYSYTSAMASYFALFAALGIKTYGQREIAQCRDNKEKASKLFWELELMCISTTVLSLIVWAFLVIFSKENSVYYTVLTMTVAATAFDISWFWKGYEEYGFIVIRNSFIKIVGIVLLFVFVHEKSDLLLYTAMIAATGLIGNISMWAHLRKYLVKVNWHELKLKYHYQETMVYFVPTIATSIYTILDKAMIGWITKSDFQNGYYEQATKIVNICKTVVISLNSVLSSRISYLFSKQAHDEIKQKMVDALNFILLIGIPIVFGIIGIARTFVPFFFGEGFEQATILLYIMSPLVLIIAISNCYGGLYFTPSGQKARSNKGIIAGAVVNLILNAILIYPFQSYGAAVASIAAEMTVTEMYIFMSRDYFDSSCILRYSWKKLIASGTMLGVVIFLGYRISGGLAVLIAQVLAGCLIYVLMLFVLKDMFFIDQSKKIFSHVFKKK